MSSSHTSVAPSPPEHAGAATAAHVEDEDMSVFLPPVIRSAGPLNRAAFAKTVRLAAARVNDPRDISRYRKALAASRELLRAERISPIVDDPSPPLTPALGVAAAARKCLLLGHGTSVTGTSRLLGRRRRGQLCACLEWTSADLARRCRAGILGRGAQGRGAEEGAGCYPLRTEVGL